MTRKELRFITVFMGVVAFVFLAVKFYEANQVKTKVKALQGGEAAQGYAAPLFEHSTIKGSKFRLADYKGKVVIINFFASWCPPCIEELPHMIKAQDKYKGRVQFVGISLDDPDASISLHAFVAEKKINYPVLYVSKEINASFGKISKIPTTFILDKELMIIKKVEGYRDKAFFEQEIKALL